MRHPCCWAVLTIGAVWSANLSGGRLLPVGSGRGSSEAVQSRERPARALALLIGIADYQHFEPNGPPGQSDLSGPRRDVDRFRASLRRYGFDGSDDVHVLIDEQASRVGIERGFQWLRDRVTDSADVVVIYYSGHGSFAPDRDGDERRITPGDTLDEGLVPWDARDVHHADQLVIDDQIRAWLAGLGTKNVTVVLDACFSGTATRGAGVSQLARSKGAPGNPSATAAAGRRQFLDDPGHVLITAASSSETAMELPLGDNGETFGVLTFFLTRALDAAGPTARYDEIMRQVGQEVRAASAGQTPQLEGERDALVFRVSERVARSGFATVTPAGAGRYSLDLGAIHGLRRDAVYDVYPPGDTRFTTGKLGQLRVDSVAERTAVAIPEGEVGVVPAGARATAVRWPRGAPPLEGLGTMLDSSAAGVRAVLDSLPFVTRAGAREAVAGVRKRGGSFEVTVRGIPLPPLSADGPGRVTGGSAALGYSGTVASLCGPLARAYAITSLGRLDNPIAPLSLAIGIRVVRSGEAPADRPEGIDSVMVGSEYDVYAKVEAPDASILYLSVAAAGYTGEPFVLFPEERGLNQPFPLNRWVAIARDVAMVEPTGIEILKAVVDSDQFDLHPLIDSFALCRQQRGNAEEPVRRWRRTPRPVTGWRASEHKLVILPAARQ